MFESKSKINEQAEREKDLTSSLRSAIDRLNKAEKEVAHLSEGGSSGQRERDRLQDLCVSLQKQVRKCVYVCARMCVCVYLQGPASFVLPFFRLSILFFLL